MYADTLMVAESDPSITGTTTDPTRSKQATLNHRVTVVDYTILGALMRWAVGLRTARVRRKTIARLSALDDRLLADIGIERSQIGIAVEGVLRAAKVRDSVAASKIHGIADGDGRPAANDNGPEAKDSFEVMARRWRKRRPANNAGGHPA